MISHKGSHYLWLDQSIGDEGKSMPAFYIIPTSERNEKLSQYIIELTMRASFTAQAVGEDVTEKIWLSEKIYSECYNLDLDS